ncbi:MAG: glycosyltransferase family 2 protein [Candidatus Kerfeldbacteria bacterium]|nr:glycosyltransferase family 2 protein [Candidatus Kerfeldbacteria bacterium]
MDLSILVLNYKTKGLLKQCLRGILDSQLLLAYEVIVVDNDSRDGSVGMVRQQFPAVQVIASPKNVGFAAGMNIGLARATGRVVLLLNPDVAIFHQAVATLIDYLDTHPQVGLAAPKLINPDGTTQLSCYRFPNIWTPLLRRTPLGRFPAGRRTLRRYLMSDWDHQDNRAVGWVLGACMLIRRTSLERIGPFDERFFLYFEDVDLCRRMWQAGWEVHYAASAEMVHYHQRLSAEYPGLQGLFSYPTRIHIQSGLKYFSKYLGSPPPPHQV